DLVTLRRKELSSIPNTGQNHQEDQLKRSIFEKQIQDADQKKTSLLEDLAELRVILDNSEKSAHDAEVVFKKSGAELYESHIEREAEIRLLDVRHSTIEEELRGLANGTAPLCFLKADILQYAQIASEHKSLEQKIAVRAALKNGIVELESWLSQKDCPKSALALIKEFRSLNLEGEECCSEELNLNVRSLQQANALVSDDGLKKDINYIHTLLEQLDDIEEEASALQKANELALSKEDAEGARNVYEESIKHLATSNATFKATEEQYNKSVLELEQATKQYDQFLQGIQLDQHDGFKAMRFSEACEKAKDSLIAFRKTVVLENAERIEARIWDRFKQLLRKKRLGYGVKIDPVNYTLSLLDKSGEVIPSERLSAGERQLLATAMLWGLADSSSMQLPVIIDTPLGRLDRKHRANLVSEYFPNASQQVVLLSTDEEIDERWLPVLEPSLARMYLIDFDDDQQCSTVVEGYFELELTHA
ncbi:MAG: DNA sulfur modification protein DndD, partial [Phycisphaerales bacterium]|nr:DNA sulfur modification protein DndD [Phycisphaerales bacterium]